MFGLPKDTVARIQAVFARYPAIDTAILYGSRAKGTHREGSDIDLTLKGEGLDLKALNRVSRDLDDLLLPYSMDLSIFDRIEDPELLDHIERCGKFFYEKSPSPSAPKY